jgi:hypothetical protein
MKQSRDKARKEFVRAVNDLQEIFKEMIEDVQLAAKSSLSGDQREARNFVRSVFASLEGLIYRVKQVAHSANGHFGIELTLGETLMLLEEAYSVQSNGSVSQTGARIPFLSNVRLAFLSLAKVTNITYALPTGEAGWQRLRTAVSVRDRLTHPKRAADLQVSHAEREAVKEGHNYFTTQLIKCLVLIKDKIAAELALEQAPKHP